MVKADLGKAWPIARKVELSPGWAVADDYAGGVNRGAIAKAGKNCALTPGPTLNKVALCLVTPKTNSPSPAQR